MLHLVAGLLFFLLSPGVLLTIPAGSRGLFASGQTSVLAAAVHAVVFVAAIYFLSISVEGFFDAQAIQNANESRCMQCKLNNNGDGYGCTRDWFNQCKTILPNTWTNATDAQLSANERVTKIKIYEADCNLGKVSSGIGPFARSRNLNQDSCDKLAACRNPALPCL